MGSDSEAGESLVFYTRLRAWFRGGRDDFIGEALHKKLYEAIPFSSVRIIHPPRVRAFH
jgi:hypothetical protein